MRHLPWPSLGRPSGERLSWQTGSPLMAELPILCGDVTPRTLRVPEGELLPRLGLGPAQAPHTALGSRHGGGVGVALQGPTAVVLAPMRSRAAPMEFAAQG